MEIQILADYWFWYALLAIAAAGLGLFSYRTSYPPIKTAWRVFLAVLRTLAIIILGTILLEPLINMFSTSTIQPKLAVLFDNSKSMDMPLENKTRLDIAGASTDSILNQLDLPYDLYVFSSDLNITNALPDRIDSTGDATSISRAFQKFFAQSDLEQYGAILLVTDGNQNLGQDPIDQALKLNMPISTFTVGNNIEEINLTVESIDFPPVAYAGDNFTVNVEISAKGIINKRSKIDLKYGNKIIVSKSFDVPEDGRRMNIALEGQISEPGNVELSISASSFADETNHSDNSRTILMRILKAKVKVLLGTSSLNWDFKFINQSLGKFDEFEIDAIYPKGAGRFSGPGPPSGLDGLKKYDVLILVDCGPGALRITPSDLKRYVGSGGSLIYVPGSDFNSDYQSFGDLLPFEFKNPGYYESEYFISTSTLKRQHSIVLLDENPDVSDNIWRSMPPVSFIITGVYPFGEILLEVISPQIKNAPQPFLVVNEYEQGKVAAFAGFTMWQSQFSSSNDDDLKAAFPDFWRNLIRWASLNDEGSNFKVINNHDVYRLGEPVNLTGYLSDESNKPKNGALISISIFEKDKTVEIKDAILSQIDLGVYQGEITGLPAGEYIFKAMATSFDDTLGRTDGAFIIEKYSLEMSSSSPDYNLTSRIAAATGGTAYNIDNIAGFNSDFSLEKYTKESVIRIRPFGTMLFLIILITAFCVEWGVRKKFRLP